MGSGRSSPINSGRRCRFKREFGGHRSSAAVGSNVQLSAKMSQSFPHTAKANSGLIGTNRYLFVRGDAPTRVFDLDDDGTILFANRDDRGIAAGVTMNIGETFLD